MVPLFSASNILVLSKKECPITRDWQDVPLEKPLTSEQPYRQFFLGYNQFHNILRLFDVLPNFSFTTSETMCDYL